MMEGQEEGVGERMGEGEGVVVRGGEEEGEGEGRGKVERAGKEERVGGWEGRAMRWPPPEERCIDGFNFLSKRSCSL